MGYRHTGLCVMLDVTVGLSAHGFVPNVGCYGTWLQALRARTQVCSSHVGDLLHASILDAPFALAVAFPDCSQKEFQIQSRDFAYRVCREPRIVFLA